MELMDRTITFMVEFDSAVWESMNDEQRSNWIDLVTDRINEEAYVSDIHIRKADS